MCSRLFLLLFWLSNPWLYAQPQPGDLFREYAWIPEMVKSENGRFLRVGGKLDYQINPDHFPVERQGEGYIPFERYVELQGATKAEVLLEKNRNKSMNYELRIRNYACPPQGGITDDH